uniref:Uncharacterized protein n=1 Tax=Lepeophtheirus salmonis TaxID=72036 RepID=A0A0K2TY08_LEPSM
MKQKTFNVINITKWTI